MRYISVGYRHSYMSITTSYRYSFYIRHIAVFIVNPGRTRVLVRRQAQASNPLSCGYQGIPGIASRSSTF